MTNPFTAVPTTPPLNSTAPSTAPSTEDKPWGRTHCKDCSKPRDPGATQYSYCSDCGRKRQRKRYRNAREASGHVVIARIDDDTTDDRRLYLFDADGKPGKCESCGRLEADGLIVELAGDRTKDPNLDWSGKPFTALCQECSRLLHKLNPTELRAVALLVQHLANMGVSASEVVPIIDFTTHTSGEQKSPGANILNRP